MEEKIELMYMGVAAILFAVAIGFFMSSHNQMNKSLVFMENYINEERVAAEKGGG